MFRTIIEIDEEKCDGCGLCIDACHEGAIGRRNGKAKLLREEYCDGLGDCLPACPTGALRFVEREAAPYKQKDPEEHMAHDHVTCPGSVARCIQREQANAPAPTEGGAVSELRQWPVQLKLVPLTAQYFDGAHLLVAADCAAYARAGFHGEFMHNRVTLIGCPKLDGVDYGEKLAEIVRANSVASLTVVRMEVPCCGGIERAAVTALEKSKKLIPWRVVTMATDGSIKEDEGR